MFVDLIMTSITDWVFFGADESHGDWHQSAMTSGAPHRHTRKTYKLESPQAYTPTLSQIKVLMTSGAPTDTPEKPTS